MIGPVPHGTASGYTTRGCKCAACRTAHAAAARARRARRRREQSELLIDSTGMLRRLRALQAIGWSAEAISEHYGTATKQAVSALLREQRSTTMLTTKQRVCAIYDELSMQLGPSRRARAIALRKGWPPPLAWDDETIDDPNAKPQLDYQPEDADDETPFVDEAVVERIMHYSTTRATVAERVEVTRRWLAAGRSQSSLSELTGWKVDRYITRDSEPLRDEDSAA